MQDVFALESWRYDGVSSCARELETIGGEHVQVTFMNRSSGRQVLRAWTSFVAISFSSGETASPWKSSTENFLPPVSLVQLMRANQLGY
jgi:hypothetical protein